MDWQSIQVYYYDQDKNRLILDGVRPLFRALAGEVDAVSYTRHWRHGPHLRLNFRTTAETFAEVVRPAADEILGGFLARHPSTRRMDPLSELRAHRRLAELEQEEGPLLPWHPDNSIVTAEYDDRAALVGGVETAAVVADFQARATELAFSMTARSGEPRERLARGFDLMIATAEATSGRGITDGFISFRSHAEGFLYGFPEGAGLRPSWDRHYGLHRQSLVRRLGAVVAAVRDGDCDGAGTGAGDGGDKGGGRSDKVGGSHAVPFVQEWIATLGPSREQARRLAAAGALTLPLYARDDAGDRPDRGATSPFHQVLLANPTWEQTQRSPAFLQYRLMLNLTYLMLTRLGISPVERFLLGHLAANAVEEAYGVSAIELVRARPATNQLVGRR